MSRHRSVENDENRVVRHELLLLVCCQKSDAGEICDALSLHAKMERLPRDEHKPENGCYFTFRLSVGYGFGHE